MSPEEYLQKNDALVADQKAKQASFLVSQPLTKSPDEYAQASTLAKSLNLPAAVVDVNYKSFAQKMLEKRNETILKASPVLSSWLTKGENYRIAADTVEEMSWWELLPKQIKEAGKAVPGGTVNAGGLALEGVGQLITPEDGSASIDLRTRIAQAKSKTPEEISALRQEIFKQGAVNPAYAQSILSDVLAGDMTPADAIEVLGPLAGLKEASVALQKGGQATQEYAAGILPADPGMEESFGRQVGGGLGSLLTILGVGLATGGVGATVFGAAGGAGEATSRARKAGEDEDTQTLAAVWGLIPGMTDAIPIERILSNPVVKSGLASVLRSIGKQAALEGGQEAVQEILQNSIARSLYAPDQNVFKGVADGFATGGFVGALVEAGRVAFNAALPGRMQKRQGAAAAAPETAGTIAEVSQAAQGSVLRQRSPETFREFVDTAMTGKPVENLYVNADAFVEYFQGIGLDPFALVDEIDGMSRADLDAALESGDLKIPTASYAAKLAGSEYDQFFQENARFDPDGMSLSEARDFEATKADLMEEAWEEAEAARQEAERLRPTDEKIYDEVVHRLRVAGQSTDVSTAVAVLPQMFYRTAAAREGISPEEYLARYPLPKFQGAIPEGMQARNVDALSRTLAEARARKSVEPQRGPSLLEFISEYGGIANDRGELRARNAEVIKRGKGKKTLRLKRSSLTDGMRSLLGSDSGKRFGVDDVAQAAIESGFLMNHPVAQEYRAAMEAGREVPDITQALWDEIDNELRDGPPTVETPESARSEYLDEIEDYLDSLGLDLTASDDAIRAAIEADQASEGRKYGQGSASSLADIEAMAAGAGVSLSISENPGAITVSKIVAAERGKGAGSRVMQAIVDYADASGKLVALTPSADFGGSVSRLKSFYARFGFVPNKGRTRDFSTQESYIRPASRPTLFQDAATGQGMATDEKIKKVADGVKTFYRGVSPETGTKTFAQGKGLYFTASKSIAKDYIGPNGRIVDIPADLLPENPIRFRNEEDFGGWWALQAENAGLRLSQWNERWRDPADYIKSLGYDGVKMATGKKATYVKFSAPHVLFQDASQGPRGSIAFPTAGIGQGDTVIRLFETSNLSTVLHELGHYFLTAMQADAARGVTHSRDDMEVAKKWWRDNAGSVAKDAMRVMPDVQVTSDDVIAALDNGTSGDMMKDAAIDVGMQEQWARGFEAFLFEGKSPSIEMRGIFAKFSAWMVSVYKKIAGLNVTINDDIRGVFDRMLATDEEIAAAQREAGSNPFQATAEELGLTPEQFSKLNKLRTQAEDQARTRLLSKMMEPEKRKREAWFKEERAKVREEIERDLKSRPVYRAIQEVRFGKDFDGAEIPGLKMSREVIEREYGAGYIPFLPGSTKDGKGHRNAVFTNEGGVHPDVLAGSYGFRSGAELLDAMTQAPPLDEAIEAETDKAMRDRHGDVMTDGSLEAEALDAVHNDKRGEWMAAELKAVIDVVGSGVGLTHKEARAAARGSMGRMTVRDATNANRFLAAERKAGEEYARLMKTLGREGVWLDNARRNMEKTARAAVRGAVSPDKVAGAIDAYNAQFETTQSTYDVAEQSRTSSKGNAYTIPAGQRTATNLGYNDLVARVVAAKRRQLMNHALYMEARLTAERVEKVTTKLAKLNRENAKQTKTRNLDQVMAARAIAARFGLARPDTTFDFDAWVTQLQLDDPGAAAAMGQAITTYANAPVPFKDLTVDQFGAVNDAIENILETGRRYRSLEIEGQTVERDAAITELTAVLEQRGLKPNAALKARLTDAQKNGRSAISMLAALRRMENWARDMDDGEQGPFTRYLVRPVMSAVDTYRGDKAERLKELLDIINPRKEELLGGSIEAPELGYTFQNKGELLHALLHTGNESNLEKLLLGRGWSDGLTDQTQAVTTKGKPRVDRQGNPIMTRGRVDTTKWDTFIARMISQGKITKEDYDTAQAVWDLMERMKRPAQTAHRKMFGYYFDEVEANVVSTPFGDYKGGYVPAIADTDASNDGQLRADQAAMEAQQTSFMFPTTGKGFTKARVQNYHTPLALNLMLLPAHMDKVLRFTHIEPTVRQTASLVTNRGMREALDAFDPSIAPNLITPWLQRTAQQAVESQPSTPAGRAFSALARGLRRRVGVHTMFANLVNTAQQVTGFASAAVLVKPANLKKALVSFSMGNASTMRAAASDKSAFMKDRIDMVGRETQRRIQDVIVEPTISGSIRDFVDKHGYFMQTATQGVVDVITWHAAYDQAIGKGLSERDAVFEADSVVRRTMGDFSPENVSMFETGSAFQRIFTMFASYFNGQANLVGGEMQTVMRTMGWAGAPRMFWIYTFGIAIPAIVGEMIVQAAKGELLDDDDDDGYLDEIAELFFGSQARYLTGMVPVAGHVTNAILSRFNDQVYDDRLSTSPVVSTVERVVGAPFSIGKAITGDGSASKAVADGLTALGMITGIPTGALAKPAGYLTGIAEGKSKPEGPIDILQGIVSGRDGSEK